MDISPAMRLNLEALPPGEAGKLPLDNLRLGSPQVLPPRTIHVVNLWATWCDPCLAELPEFKSMFGRHREWDDVRFVPIQIKDHTDPLRSYHDYAGVMPPAPIRLADRTMSDALASTLAEGDNGGLYRGNLPVTLVLDCNRRVRWAKFEQLGEADFAALEPLIDQLRAELADTRPGAWCTQEWPGNGRCEALELTAAHHSFEDCGPLRRRSSDLPGTAEVVEPEPAEPVAVPSSPEILPTTCPPKTRLRNGKCSRLQKLPELQVTAPASSPMCGNGVCDPTRAGAAAVRTARAPIGSYARACAPASRPAAARPCSPEHGCDAAVAHPGAAASIVRARRVADPRSSRVRHQPAVGSKSAREHEAGVTRAGAGIDANRPGSARSEVLALDDQPRHRAREQTDAEPTQGRPEGGQRRMTVLPPMFGPARQRALRIRVVPTERDRAPDHHHLAQNEAHAADRRQGAPCDHPLARIVRAPHERARGQPAPAPRSVEPTLRTTNALANRRRQSASVGSSHVLTRWPWIIPTPPPTSPSPTAATAPPPM
ncbi:TlpA family protein disulfide reductase [Nannocystis pusilla]|uniref:TlpA family protein disulfide reductase n=1 Tax=Nannocystis pusilla TaxID=889268 RepID=UPI003B7F99DC